MARLDVDSIVKWWARMMNSEKYPAFSSRIKGVLSIAHGPVVESLLSLMGDVIHLKPSNMDISTFDSSSYC